MTPAWFYALVVVAVVVLPGVVGLWISGPERMKDALRWLVGLFLALLVIASLVGLAGAALFSVVRLIRLAWGS